MGTAAKIISGDASGEAEVVLNLGAGAGLSARCVGLDDQGAEALGGGVVLDHDGAEPLDQGALDADRARGGAVDDEAQRCEVVALPRALGQGQHAVEHGRHHVGVGDAVPLNQAQGLRRIPALHDHDGHAIGERHGDGEGERGGVIERTRAQVRIDAAGPVLVVAAEIDGGQRAGRLALAVHALGATGGP